MHTIDFEGQSVVCLDGSNLRMALLHARIPLYNDAARAINCHGRGVCGTCAVHIEGPVSEPTATERVRLKLTPNAKENELRLACQCNVLGDVKVKKLSGLFGNRP